MPCLLQTVTKRCLDYLQEPNQKNSTKVYPTTNTTNSAATGAGNVVPTTQVCYLQVLIILHSEMPKLYTILAFLSAIGLINAYVVTPYYTPDIYSKGYIVFVFFHSYGHSLICSLLSIRLVEFISKFLVKVSLFKYISPNTQQKAFIFK